MADITPEVRALWAGEKVRPLGRKFHVFLGVLTLAGSAFLVASIVFILELAPFTEWEGTPRLARVACGLYGVAVAVGLLSYMWGTKLHVAVRLSADALTFWDWRGRRHEIAWDEVTEVEWWRARKRICKWDLSLRYRPRYAIERKDRRLKLWTADGWRPEIAEALRDEIVSRSELQLVEGDPDQDGDKVWRRVESQP